MSSDTKLSFENIDDTDSSPIKIENLTKVYNEGDNNEVIAVKDVSFDIHPGEFISIIGPSGCGKTTVLKCVGDLISPTSGEILINGMTNTEARQSRQMAFFFQEDVLLPWRTVLENIMLPLDVMDSHAEDREEKCKEFLETVGLSGFETKYPAELSGGMRQRVALARGFVYDPSIFLMDEPFAALDELTRREMNKELLRIHSDIQKTTVFVTHHIDEAVWLSDRIVVLSPHPGEVHDIIDIPIDRPRSEKTRESDEFIETKQYLMDVITDL